ncbi:MAG: hypothetical protein K0S77_2169 [Pseudomonas sp.]|jgi:hypothetical protein|uniref:hypothetical protein n=1 Tax=Pseudomonas entomophila TaxID=312306 RepID=UPI0015E29E55|nr:hypothetical protein [Pseudomonas entomophila]MBA1191276.1 hypothetical protein [Pseudomonas entomophila]MDF2489547.1 hypothetical protein [Pseudomonas sp.]
MSCRTESATLSIRRVDGGPVHGRPLRRAHFLVTSPAWCTADDGVFATPASAAGDPHGALSDPLKHSLALAGEGYGVVASALFVSITDTGRARILGRMNAAAWRQWIGRAAG